MKKNLIQLLIVTAVTVLILGINAVALAQTDPISVLDNLIQKSGLESFANRYHKLSSVEPGADNITSIVFFIIDFTKYILGAVAVIYFIYAGFSYVTAEEKIDEIAKKQKENLKYIIYGLIFVIVSDELVANIFGDYGECFSSVSNAKECALGTGKLIKGIYSFVLYVMGTAAVLVSVLSAFRMVTSMGEEETITREKKRLVMSTIGLIIAGVGEYVIKGIVFPSGGEKFINIPAGQMFVYNFTNFISGFISVGALGMLLYGGYLYVASAGNDEETGKAKKIMISAFIGIIIALAAFGLTNTLISFSSDNTGGGLI